MKTIVIATAVLAVGSMLLFAQTNHIETADVWFGSTISVATSVTIGPVTICTTNGAVTIKPGVSMDDASKEFWKALERAYPGMFPTTNSANASSDNGGERRSEPR